MGWGTEFTTEVFLNRMAFKTKNEVEQKIQENLDSIEDAKKRLQMFIASTPSDIIDPEWKEQPIDWLVNNTDVWFEIIKDATRDNVLLNLYLTYIEDNGNLIKRTEEE